MKKTYYVLFVVAVNLVIWSEEITAFIEGFNYLIDTAKEYNSYL
jgi:hypothetical protein